MLKIVILTDQVSKIGGITNLIYLKSNFWVQKRGYDVSIITTEQKEQPSFYPIDEKVGLLDLGINYDRNKSYFLPPNIFKVLSNYFRLRKRLKKIMPDVVIIANHIPVTFFFPLLNVKTKFVKEYHYSKYYISKSPRTPYRKFEQYIESKLDKIVVLNEEEIQFYPKNRTVQIANPIDIGLSKLDENHTQRDKVAIAAGRIAKVKRFDKLVEIWYEFAQKNSDWVLEIYGDGEPEDLLHLQTRIKALKLENRIRLMPPTNQLKSVMKKSSLYLMTSAQECFPMVLLEAMSCGLPVISYDCPTGPRNIISHGVDGLLVPFDNQEEFVKILQKAVMDVDLRNKLANNGLKTVQKYSIGKIMSEWDKLILEKDV